MSSIHTSPIKIKSFQAILIILLVTLSLVAAFILGRLSAAEQPQKANLSIEPAACPVPDVESSGAAITSNPVKSSVQGAFLASRNGTKFYPADCSYADRIGDANRVWFATEAEATAAGYERSAQCLDE